MSVAGPEWSKGRSSGLQWTVEAGELADITVLSQNILTVPDDQLLATKVLYTIVGGKVLYQAR